MVLHVLLYLIHRYYDAYLPSLLEACTSENPDVMQVCIFYVLLPGVGNLCLTPIFNLE
jgi:hypothetical protein